MKEHKCEEMPEHYTLWLDGDSWVMDRNDSSCAFDLMFCPFCGHHLEEEQ